MFRSDVERVGRTVTDPGGDVVGKVARVTGSIAPGRIGEVMIAVRGGSEAFHAYSADPAQTIARGTRVLVVEYFPPRTVVVSPY
jgi:hypothetical protein